MSAQDAVAELQQSLQQWRREKEKEFLKMAARYLGQHLSTTTTGHSLNSVINTDVLLIAQLGNDHADWPTALVANFVGSVTELGPMDNNGSLWRLVTRTREVSGEEDGGLRVLLQTAEIGEQVSYLTEDLELSCDSHKAAEWLVRKVNPKVPLQETTTINPFLDFQISTCKGLVVQLELASYQDKQEEPRLLVAAVSTDAHVGEKGVAVLTEKMTQVDASFNWTLNWEVLREDMHVDGLDNLGEELPGIGIVPVGVVSHQQG